MSKIARKILRWRKRQKEGAIMSSAEFKKIERGAATNPEVTDPTKIAANIYWNRVRNKQKGPKKEEK